MAGEWDVSVIECGMTAKRFIEWEVYARLEPFNELRADYRSARIAATVANMMGRGKDQKAYTDDDFLLKWRDADEEPEAAPPAQTAEQLERKMSIIFGVMAK